MSDHQIAGISLKDSGKRQEWNTGSRRDTREGKGSDGQALDSGRVQSH